MEDCSDASSGDPVPETKQQEEVEPSRGDRWNPLDIDESKRKVSIQRKVSIWRKVSIANAYPSLETYLMLHMIRHENGNFTPVYDSVDVTYDDVARAVEPSLDLGFEFSSDGNFLL